MPKKRRKTVAENTASEARTSEALLDEAQSKQDHTTSASSKRHYVELDALRGIAFLAVLALHSAQAWYLGTQESLRIFSFDLQPRYQEGGLTFLGIFGVVLFFLLSGYLLTWVEERRASRGNYSLRSYTLRRAYRLFPPYWVILLVGGFLVWPAGKTFVDVVSHLTMMQSFVPHLPRLVFDPALWYLTSEVVFYVALPFLVLKARGLYPRLAIMGGLLVAAFATELCTILYTSEGDWLHYYLRNFPSGYLWLFMAGVLFRTVIGRMQEEGRTFSFQPHLASLLLVISGLLLILHPVLWDTLEVSNPVLVSLISMLSDTLPGIAFFAAAILGSPWLLPLLRWKALAFIGMISYSLYLLHNTILFSTLYGLPLLKIWLKPWMAQQGALGVWAVFAAYFGAVLLLCIALSYLSYRYIERPFLRLRPE